MNYNEFHCYVCCHSDLVFWMICHVSIINNYVVNGSLCYYACLEAMFGETFEFVVILCQQLF